MEKYLPVLEATKYDNFVRYLNKMSSNSQIRIVSENPSEDFKDFFSGFKFIETAGGLVHNEANDSFLFIVRHGLWDIPKGKIEKSEDVRSAAIREVEEECGIDSPIIDRFICHTYHCFNPNGKPRLKKNNWFLMKSNTTSGLKPQQEEGITEVRWLTKKEFEIVRSHTYPSIEDVLDLVEENLEGF
ncbi:MAG: NUDIX domain-containing protein [Brumimicrobium sp.]|nr:NUDIX domain-containing protein [Brumimicrobium sp.]